MADQAKPVEANEFRITWIVGAIGVVGPALSTFVVTTYPNLPKGTPVIPAAVLGVIAITILAVMLVFIADIHSRAAITVARYEPEQPTVGPDKASEPVEATEFRLTWVAMVIGAVGPVLAAFVAHTYPGVPPDDMVIPVAVRAVMAVSIASVALVFFFDVRSRAAVTVAIRSKPR